MTDWHVPRHNLKKRVEAGRVRKRALAALPPNIDLAFVYETVQSQGWYIEPANQSEYVKVRCNCSAEHLQTVLLNPSHSTHYPNVIIWLRTWPCWVNA